MMILIIDNYDSFTYNLYQAVGTLTPSVQVVRNDSLTVSEAAALQPQAIILSPGPGKPNEAGITEAVLEELKGQVPILGVCLGHQAMGEVFGGTVTLAPHLVHGRRTTSNLTAPVRFLRIFRPSSREPVIIP